MVSTHIIFFLAIYWHSWALAYFCLSLVTPFKLQYIKVILTLLDFLDYMSKLNDLDVCLSVSKHYQTPQTKYLIKKKTQKYISELNVRVEKSKVNNYQTSYNLKKWICQDNTKQQRKSILNSSKFSHQRKFWNYQTPNKENKKKILVITQNYSPKSKNLSHQ